MSLPARSLPAELHGLLRLGKDQPAEHRAKALPLRLGADPSRSALDAVLPDGGLPRGAVVELASPRVLGHATTLALRACSAAQSEARLRGGAGEHWMSGGAWCAFVDPWSTLHAPAVVASGVDPSRLLVVRTPLDALSRVVVRIAESRVFSVVAVDTAGVPGAASGRGADPQSVRLDRWATVVRRLALAVESTDTMVLLLTDATAHRSMPLPVALRLEIERVATSGSANGASAASPALQVRVAKDRYGRVAPPKTVELGEVERWPELRAVGS